MRQYCCLLQGFEDYSLFVGCLLAEHEKTLDKIRNSTAFRSNFEEKLRDFYSIYETYNVKNLEKYIGR